MALSLREFSVLTLACIEDMGRLTPLFPYFEPSAPGTGGQFLLHNL